MDWGGEPIRVVADAAIGQAKKLTVDRKGRPRNIDWQIECWANVNGPGNANRRHSHPGCYWSGTYYVDDGEDGITEDVAGQFEFHDPRGVAAAVVPACARQSRDEALVRPQSGSMVLFPSWVPHSVRPYRGRGLRISIAFNLAIGGRGG